MEPPVDEMRDYLIKTVSNPQDYILKTVEGYKSVAGVILNACIHTLERPSATPEQNFEFASNQNKAIHAFFDGWKKLEVAQKKEFLAQIVVDTAINKVAYSLPKLILKIGGSSALSSAIQQVGSVFDKIDPGSSGAAVIAVPINIAEDAVRAIEYAAGVVGSTPVAVVSAGIQDTVILSEAMHSGGGSESSKIGHQSSYELPVEKFKAHTTIVEGGVTKVVETSFSTEEALEILNNSQDLKVLNSRIEGLKQATQDIKFGVSHKRFEHSLKLFEKAINESEQFYEIVRKSPQDIEKIYQNTGVPKNILQKIKNHVFIEKHILSGVKNERIIDRFASDIDIAEAWKRLCDGNFVQSDLLFLQHELSESLIMRGTKIDYEIAHYRVIDLIYNWQNIL